MSALARKNLVVDPAKVWALATRFGTSESEAVHRAVDTALTDTVLGRLEQQYRVVDPVGVHAYLERHSFLEPIVEDAHAAILATFGTIHHVDLTLIVDPEDSASDLFALVHTPLPPVEAWQALARFDADWSDRAPTQGRFHVDVEVDDVIGERIITSAPLTMYSFLEDMHTSGASAWRSPRKT